MNVTPPFSLTQRAMDGLALSVNYLGLPWMRGVPAGGWLIGIVALVASAGTGMDEKLSQRMRALGLPVNVVDREAVACERNRGRH